jgi:hypothetical protein
MIGGRGLTIDVGTVKLQLAERTIDTAPDLTTSFSHSPFELDQEPIVEGSVKLGDMAPQITFQVSDYVGRYWEKGNANLASQMRAALAALEVAKGQDIRTSLEAFATLLEQSRFLEAYHFGELLRRSEGLRSEVDKIQKLDDCVTDSNNFLILPCVGVAHAQQSEWEAAKTVLDKIVWKGDLSQYLPATDVWLSSTYNDFVTKRPDLGLGSPEFLEDVRGFLSKAATTLNVMPIDAEAWTQKYPSAKAGTKNPNPRLLKRLLLAAARRPARRLP